VGNCIGRDGEAVYHVNPDGQRKFEKKERGSIRDITRTPAGLESPGMALKDPVKEPSTKPPPKKDPNPDEPARREPPDPKPPAEEPPLPPSEKPPAEEPPLEEPQI